MTAKHLPGIVAPLDALLLKGDADPATRAIMSSALVLDRAPEFDRLTEAFERATRAVPRMRATVVKPSMPLGQAQWVPDDHFEVLDHVRQVGAPGDGSLDAVLAMASASATAPFDPARALWDAVLVTGLKDGTTVVLVRVHHAIADGVRLIQMMAHLLDLEPDPAKPDLPTLEQRGASLTRTSERLVHTASQTALTHQRRALHASRAMLRSVIDPVGSVSGAASYTRSAVRTYGSGGATPSPLLQSRSRTRTFGILELGLDQMRSCAKASSATVNDVFLAGLIGGMGRYHEAFGATVNDIPVSFPINVAGDANPESGNHFSAAVIAGPSSVADPATRLRLVHDLVVSRRAEPGLDAPLRLAPVLHQAPSWLAAAGMNAYSRRIDLQASNIVGPDCPVYLAGARVIRFYAFGPLPGVPVMAVLVSYEQTCTVGFTVDPAAVTDPQLFMRLTGEAFAELLAMPTR
jgi:diacylglycerol O-acyltransferase